MWLRNVYDDFYFSRVTDLTYAKSAPVYIFPEVSYIFSDVSYIFSEVSYIFSEVSYIFSEVAYIFTEVAYIFSEVSYIFSEVSYIFSKVAYIFSEVAYIFSEVAYIFSEVAYIFSEVAYISMKHAHMHLDTLWNSFFIATSFYDVISVFDEHHCYFCLYENKFALFYFRLSQLFDVLLKDVYWIVQINLSRIIIIILTIFYNYYNFYFFPSSNFLPTRCVAVLSFVL